MRKVFFLLLAIQTFSIAAPKRKERIEFKTGVEIINKQPTKITNFNYNGVDLTYYSPKRDVKINFQIKGNRGNILEPSLVTTYNKLELESLPEVKLSEVEDPIFGTPTITEEYYGDVYTTSEENYHRVATAISTEKGLFSDITKDNGHDHNHDHSGHNHEHHHNHNHDEMEHEGHFKREGFNLLKPKLYETRKSYDDFQSKFDIEYFNGKNGVRYIQYLTNFKEEDERKFKGDAIYQFKHLSVFDNKFSISVIPRLYTRKVFSPLYVDLDLDLRYQINKDTTIGAFYYTATQLEDMKNYVNNKNKIELFYDYNTQKFRAHRFYDIVDHEHDKLDQIKVKLSLEHNNVKKVNNFSKNINDLYDNDKHTFKTNLELNLKKSDAFVKGLSFSNDFYLRHNYAYEQKLERFYNSKNIYKFKDTLDKSLVYDFVNNSLTIGKEEDKIEFSKLYKTDKGFELHRLHSADVVDTLDPASPKKTVKFLEIIESTNDDNSGGKITTDYLNNNINLKNDSMIKYVFKDNEIYLENKLKLDEIITTKEHSIENETTLKYNRKIDDRFNIGLKLANKFSTYNDSKIYPYYTDIITSGFDFSHKLKNDKTKFEYGLGFDYNIELRKSNNNYLSHLPENLLQGLPPNVADEFRNQAKNEANKVVIGHEIVLKPYVKLEYELIKNLKLNGEINIDTRFEKSVLKKYYGSFSPIEHEMKAGKTVTTLKFGLSYVY